MIIAEVLTSIAITWYVFAAVGYLFLQMFSKELKGISNNKQYVIGALIIITLVIIVTHLIYIIWR